MTASRNLLRNLQNLITLGQKTEKFNRIFEGVSDRDFHIVEYIDPKLFIKDTSCIISKTGTHSM